MIELPWPEHALRGHRPGLHISLSMKAAAETLGYEVEVRPMEAERGAQGEKGEGASASKGKGEEKAIEE